MKITLFTFLLITACGGDIHHGIERMSDASPSSSETGAGGSVGSGGSVGTGGLMPGCQFAAGARCGYAPPVDAGHPDAAPDSAPEGGLSLGLEYSAPIAPGEESLTCALIDGPTEETWISGWSAKLSSVHHAGIWLLPAGKTFDSKNCSANASALLFTALTAHFEQRIPVDGGAMRIPAGTRFVLDIHRLNATTEAKTASASIALTVVPTHSVEVFMSYVDGHKFSVAPHSQQTISFACQVPAALQFMSLIAHTHSHTTAAVASSNGTEVYRSMNWSEPETKYYAPFAPGKLAWSCDINNNLDTPLTWAIQRDTGEMCQLYALTLGGAFSCST